MAKHLALIALTLLLVPGLAFSATKKTAANTTADNEPAANQTIGSGSSVSFDHTALKGLSVFAAYDFTDSLTYTGAASGNADIDKTFLIGAEYQFAQFSPGLSFQVGGDYEFARSVVNSNGLQISTWMPFAEVVANLTLQFSLMGGVNYGFPSMTGAADGASIKGNVGFQFGGSFLATKNVAIDGRYRSVADNVSAAGGKASTDIKLSGFEVGGRFLF